MAQPGLSVREVDLALQETDPGGELRVYVEVLVAGEGEGVGGGAEEGGVVSAEVKEEGIRSAAEGGVVVAGCGVVGGLGCGVETW